MVPSKRQARAVFGLAALGLLTFGGCGPANSPPECSFFSNTCNPTVGSFTLPATAAVFPYRLIVQAGATAVFAVNTTAQQPSYQWQRSADAGQSYVNIAGATGGTLTLTIVPLADDATVLRVQVQGGGASVTATAQLLVASRPGLVYADGDFQNANWAVDATVSPLVGGPSHSVDRAAAGGNPAAYRAMVHSLTAGPSTLDVFHRALAATYDPASQGAIAAIDYTEDCIRQPTSTLNYQVQSSLLLEQGSRRYLAASSDCTASLWTPMPKSASLNASAFVLVQGPVCTAAEACPDFGAGGALLRFGYARRATLAAGVAAGTVVHGIDNWQVTVWRR